MNRADRRILYAEDNTHDVEMTLDALSGHRLTNEIVVVVDGAEALDYLYRRGNFAQREAGNPLLVILDLKMPKVDGLKVLRTLKSDPYLKAIPVVMLTSSREEQDLVRSYELGVNAYIVKPVQFPAFVDAVRNLGMFWTVYNAVPAPGCATSEGSMSDR